MSLHSSSLIIIGLFESSQLSNGFAANYLERSTSLPGSGGGGLISFTLKDASDISALCGRLRLVSTGTRSVESYDAV
jgi:hypothetical protein